MPFTTKVQAHFNLTPTAWKQLHNECRLERMADYLADCLESGDIEAVKAYRQELGRLSAEMPREFKGVGLVLLRDQAI